MAPKRDQVTEYCILKDCKQRRKKTENMVRCIICSGLFHPGCIETDADTGTVTVGSVWTCKSCRKVFTDVTEMKHTLGTDHLGQSEE